MNRRWYVALKSRRECCDAGRHETAQFGVPRPRMGQQLQLVHAVKDHERTHRPAAAEQCPQPLIGEHALDEVLAQRRIVQTAFLFDRQIGHRADQRLGEQPAAGACHAAIVVHTDALETAARRILLQARSRRDSPTSASRTRDAANVVMRLGPVLPALDAQQTYRLRCPPRAPSSLATRWIASRGVPMPTSTSGHTGTHSTKRPKVETRNASRLWPPSWRTSSPRRHREMPMRGRWRS